MTPPPHHLRNASRRQSCERAWHGRHQQNRISNHSDKIVEQRGSVSKRARRRGLRNGECSGALLPEAPRVAHRSSAPASDSTFNSASIRTHTLNLGRIRRLCFDTDSCTNGKVNVETLLCQDDEINIIFMTGSYVRVGLLWPRVLEHILLAAARRRRREASFFFRFFWVVMHVCACL